MPFRDDLEAARQEILSLQGQLKSAERQAAREGEARKDRHQVEVAELEQRIAALEAVLGRSRALSPNRIWLLCWSPALIMSVIQILGWLSWPAKSVAIGWTVCQIGLVFGILGTVVSWWRRGLLRAWAGLAVLKLGVVVAWGWGWWSPFYSELPCHSLLEHARHQRWFGFFWIAPVVLIAIVVLEGILIRNGFRPTQADPAEVARRQALLKVAAILSLLDLCGVGLVALLLHPKWESELLIWIALLGAPGTLALLGQFIYKRCVPTAKSSAVG